VTWRKFGEFPSWLEEEGISVNYAPLVGHNTIRAQALGPDFKRRSTRGEIEDMYEGDGGGGRGAGALALSCGLDYAPGRYAIGGR